MFEDKIRLMLDKLGNLDWEIRGLEKEVQNLIDLKMRVLEEPSKYGFRDPSDFKTYLDENPAATPTRELSRRNSRLTLNRKMHF